MYCTKCGKEIPEGENKVCEDCKKKVIEEIVTEEKENIKEENIVKDDKSEKQENETKNNKNVKEKKDNNKKEKWKISKENKSKDEKNGKFRKVFGIISLALVLLILALIYVCGNTNKVGNTIGNIRNYGYSAEQGNWIYYLAPNKESTEVGIFRIRKDGTNQEELYMGDIDIVSINVYKNYIYFVGVKAEAYNEEDEFDNKIYKMKLDGTDLKVINDNELNDNCYEIYVLNNSVYYIGKNAEICKMDLNGENKTVVLAEETGYLGITPKYIVYNKLETAESTDYVTYIANIDGTNPRAIIPGKRLYSINIDGNYIYYTDTSKHIYKTEIDSEKEELLYNNLEAYNLNVKNGYAYYLDYKDETSDVVCVCRVNLNNIAEREIIKELASYSSYIDVVGNWVIYMDASETEGFIDLVKVDGTEEVRLYTLDYEEYYQDLLEDDYSDASVDSSVEIIKYKYENVEISFEEKTDKFNIYLDENFSLYGNYENLDNSTMVCNIKGHIFYAPDGELKNENEPNENWEIVFEIKDEKHLEVKEINIPGKETEIVNTIYNLIAVGNNFVLQN